MNCFRSKSLDGERRYLSLSRKQILASLQEEEAFKVYKDVGEELEALKVYMDVGEEVEAFKLYKEVRFWRG